MRQRLKSDLVSDLTNAQVGVEQQVPRLLHSHAREVVGEVGAGCLLEHFAEIEGAHVDRPGDLAQRQLIRLMLLDVLFGARDGRRLGVFPLNDELVAQHREVLGENAQ